MSTIKYPNAISTINTMQQKSYSSRGMRLENDINDSNKYYRELDKALIYKKPTPVQVVHVDYPKRQRAKITEAYYKMPSTVDSKLLIDKIENIDKSSIPYSWFQSHGILIQEGLYPRLAYLKAVDELYFKEDK